MKATRDQTPFVPVTLILETQSEVDAIYAVLNHNRLCQVLGFNLEYEQLSPYRDADATMELHTKLTKLMK